MRILLCMAIVMVGLAAAECSRTAAHSSSTDLHPVANVEEVMEGIVVPSSNIVFDAVVYSNGELIQAPKTDDEWMAVRAASLATAEAGNLLLMAPRAKDAKEWAQFSRELTEAGAHAAEAAAAHDIDRLLQTGSEMYTACTACHAKYIPRQNN